MTIALVTCKELPDLYEDDVLFKDELIKLQFNTQPVIWNDPAIDWFAFDAIIVRSTWDYFYNMPEFTKWFELVEKTGVPVWNPVQLMRWNSNKTYLRDLEKKGVTIVPTVWIESATQPQPLSDILAKNGWDEAILKPSISGTAHLTVRVNAQNASEHQHTLNKILTFSTALLQPFLNEIQEVGEYSFLFFGGEYQFTVLKTPKENDFRVQFEFGGITTNVVPPPTLLEQAKKVMAALANPPLYARVDAVNINGQLHLMELELIEPLLFLDYQPGAAAVLAAKFAESIRR